MLRLGGGFGTKVLAVAASIAVDSVFATIELPLCPEEGAARREEWIAATVDRSDLVLSAHVSRVAPEFQLGPVVGNWIFVVTGSRLGLPEYGTELAVSLNEGRVLKGIGGVELTIRYNSADPVAARRWSDVPYEPRRILEGHEYVFFCRGASRSIEVIDFTDTSEDPPLAGDVLSYIRRVSTAHQRRRTTHSSGRDRVSRPVQGTGRATRRAR